MREIALTFDGTVFRPADSAAVEMADQLPRDKRLHAKVTVASARAGAEDPRTGKMNLYWAGIGILLQNQLAHVDKKEMHEHLMGELGYTERHYRIVGQNPDGSTIYDFTIEPRSISKLNMQDDDFDILFERARAYVVEHHGFDPWDTWIDEAEAKEAAKDAQRRGQ